MAQHNSEMAHKIVLPQPPQQQQHRICGKLTFSMLTWVRTTRTGKPITSLWRWTTLYLQTQGPSLHWSNQRSCGSLPFNLFVFSLACRSCLYGLFIQSWSNSAVWKEAPAICWVSGLNRANCTTNLLWSHVLDLVFTIARSESRQSIGQGHWWKDFGRASVVLCTAGPPVHVLILGMRRHQSLGTLLGLRISQNATQRDK